MYCGQDNSPVQGTDDHTTQNLKGSSPDKLDKELFRELGLSKALILPAEFQSIKGGNAMYVGGCEFVYPTDATTGFTNLITSKQIPNQVEKFWTCDSTSKKVRFHFAVEMAMALDSMRTRAFIKDHPKEVGIAFKDHNRFSKYHFDDATFTKIPSTALAGKVVIVTFLNSDDEFVVKHEQSKPNDDKLRRMSSSEIYASIVCLILDL
jgi:hypothetical protein